MFEIACNVHVVNTSRGYVNRQVFTSWALYAIEGTRPPDSSHNKVLTRPPLPLSLAPPRPISPYMAAFSRNVSPHSSFLGF